MDAYNSFKGQWKKIRTAVRPTLESPDVSSLTSASDNIPRFPSGSASQPYWGAYTNIPLRGGGDDTGDTATEISLPYTLNPYTKERIDKITREPIPRQQPAPAIEKEITVGEFLNQPYQQPLPDPEFVSGRRHRPETVFSFPASESAFSAGGMNSKRDFLRQVGEVLNVEFKHREHIQANTAYDEAEKRRLTKDLEYRTSKRILQIRNEVGYDVSPPFASWSQSPFY
jgi:hypothetical protein